MNIPHVLLSYFNLKKKILNNFLASLIDEQNERDLHTTFDKKGTYMYFRLE